MKIFGNKIITFHKIDDGEWINNVLDFLKKNFNMVSIQQLEDYYYGKQNIKNSCHITFDDGELSFYNIVYPLLKEKKIPSTIFISPLSTMYGKNLWFQEVIGYDGLILKDIIAKNIGIKSNILLPFSISSILKNMQQEIIYNTLKEYRNYTNTPEKKPMNINIDQLNQLNNSEYVEIGAHTMNHPILLNESFNSANYEINESINKLSKLINKQVYYFAYPNGCYNLDYSNREINILKESSIKLAFSTEHNNFSRKNSPYRIPRYGLSSGGTSFITKKLILGKVYTSIRNRLFSNQNEERVRILKIFRDNKVVI